MLSLTAVLRSDLLDVMFGGEVVNCEFSSFLPVG